LSDYPRISLNWNLAFRVIPTRYPAIGLFDRVASPDDFDALYALEAMTNERIRNEVGDISLVPPEERLFGEGSTPIMASFTHLNKQGSRFSDGSYGVFYCAKKRDTAIAETRYHQSRFMQATSEPPMRLQMRLYAVEAKGRVVDLRKASIAEPKLLDPDSYAWSQGIGKVLRAEGVLGIIYPSVRHAGGQCLAAFKPTLLKYCLHAAYLEYHWNGKDIDAVYEVSRVG
jgi:hypothetical protein